MMISFRTYCLLVMTLALSWHTHASSLDCDGDCGKWRGITHELEFNQLPLCIPYRSCFERAAADYGLPAGLLAAVGSGESDFNSNAVSKRGAIGVMQIRWPLTARHLGFGNRSKLFDPCINIDAGARYLKELSERYDRNPHYMLWAYYFGPSRVSLDNIPLAASQYSDYIYERYAGLANYDLSPVTVLDLKTSVSARRWQRVLSKRFPQVQFSVTAAAPSSHHIRASGGTDVMAEFLDRFNAAFTF